MRAQGEQRLYRVNVKFAEWGKGHIRKERAGRGRGCWGGGRESGGKPPHSKAGQGCRRSRRRHGSCRNGAGCYIQAKEPRDSSLRDPAPTNRAEEKTGSLRSE